MTLICISRFTLSHGVLSKNSTAESFLRLFSASLGRDFVLDGGLPLSGFHGSHFDSRDFRLRISHRRLGVDVRKESVNSLTITPVKLYSPSGCLLVKVVQHPTQPLTALDRSPT